ncbi:MAG TPA: hypothetical protein VF863_02155 [Candidatus Acidoferrum sp.]
MLNSRFSPVNNQLARRFTFLALTSASLVSIFLFGAASSIVAQPQALEECVERLARKAVALRHERRMSLLWTNHTTLPEQRAEHLRVLFEQRLEAAQVRFLQGEAAPALSVSIEQTPSQFIFTASVPSEGSTNIVIEDVARSLAGSDERPSNAIRIEKELLWQQEARILSAVLPAVPTGAEKKMILLTEDALVIYSEGQGSWKLLATKTLPGPKQPPRSARGQLLLAEENMNRAGILLPGRRCEANLADDSPIACGGGGSDWPAGRLLSIPACGTQTWWLKSDGTDWTAEDRLFLRSSGAAKESAPVAEWNVPGAVFSIGAGSNAASAAVVVRSLLSGNYEVYRIELACTN